MTDLTYQLIASSLTRFGAVLLLIFGVQILVQLYKYNVRLAAFYEAQADAIELGDPTEIESFRQLVNVLSPNHIDFGNTPQLPSAEIIELARLLAEKDK